MKAKAKRGFQFWSGDVNWLDYGGTWIRKVGPRRWHFIQHTNMDEACGRDNEGQPRYVVELSEVDLDAIPPATQKSAWESCDGESMLSREGAAQTVGDPQISERDLVSADCCFHHGARAPLHSETTNNATQGFRACRVESYRLTADSAAYREAMARPVNKIGSTAAEYMAGDLTSAIVRGAEAGDPSAKIIAKMYVASQGQTLGGQIPASDLAAMTDALASKS